MLDRRTIYFVMGQPRQPLLRSRKSGCLAIDIGESEMFPERRHTAKVPVCGGIPGGHVARTTQPHLVDRVIRCGTAATEQRLVRNVDSVHTRRSVYHRLRSM